MRQRRSAAVQRGKVDGVVGEMAGAVQRSSGSMLPQKWEKGGGGGGRGLAQHTRGIRRSGALVGPGSGRRHRPGHIRVGGTRLLRAVREKSRGRER
jgi:hypothetical protein